jgi:hypothetical protein
LYLMHTIPKKFLQNAWVLKFGRNSNYMAPQSCVFPNATCQYPTTQRGLHGQLGEFPSKWSTIGSPTSGNRMSKNIIFIMFHSVNQPKIYMNLYYTDNHMFFSLSQLLGINGYLFMPLF